MAGSCASGSWDRKNSPGATSSWCTACSRTVWPSGSACTGTGFSRRRAPTPCSLIPRRCVRLSPEAADVYCIFDLPAPVQLVWEWNTDASRRTQWVEDVVRVDVNTVGGRRGGGTPNHCVHGHRDSHLEEIVDWRAGH